MPNEHLGLFDTPPSRQDVRASIVVIALLLGFFLVVMPARDVPLAEFVAFIPIVNSLMFVGELVVAALLYGQAAVFRSRALSVLATGFVFLALLLVPHTLTFPGSFAPDGLLGAGVNTTAWVATFRRVGFPIFVGLYVVISLAVDEKDRGRPPSMALGLIVAGVLSLGVTLLATIGHDMLPPMFLNRTEVVQQNLMLTSTVAIALTGLAGVLLFVKRRSVLDLWLLVALAAWLIQSALNLPLRARFSLGFYALYLMMLISHMILVIALIAESNRLYGRLALATAARNREKEAQRMSIDAAAAAISHEVGQPLAAVTLNATAGLNLLAEAPPDTGKAAEAFRAVNESVQRSFEVLKSIRAMFAKEPGWASEFDLNQLVRETSAQLAQELAGAKATLDLSLDEALPPVFGNQVQMQHVLINLIANAIESVIAANGRRRCIAVTTRVGDHGKILLDVADNGVGITADDTWRVFEAFNGTRASGAGIGLSLCRTIVEEHGSSIAASRGEENGATFRVQLPGSRALSASPENRAEAIDA